MTITKQTVADKIASYLRHDISLEEFVSWVENAMMDGEAIELWDNCSVDKACALHRLCSHATGVAPGG